MVVTVDAPTRKKVEPAERKPTPGLDIANEYISRHVRERPEGYSHSEWWTLVHTTYFYTPQRLELAEAQVPKCEHPDIVERAAKLKKVHPNDGWDRYHGYKASMLILLEELEARRGTVWNPVAAEAAKEAARK